MSLRHQAIGLEEGTGFSAVVGIQLPDWTREKWAFHPSEIQQKIMLSSLIQQLLHIFLHKLEMLQDILSNGNGSDQTPVKGA